MRVVSEWKTILLCVAPIYLFSFTHVYESYLYRSVVVIWIVVYYLLHSTLSSVLCNIKNIWKKQLSFIFFFLESRVRFQTFSSVIAYRSD